MRKKLVVLDEETYELAQKKPNFSEWVRSMLLLHDERRKEQDEIAFKIWMVCVCGSMEGKVESMQWGVRIFFECRDCDTSVAMEVTQ